MRDYRRENDSDVAGISDKKLRRLADLLDDDFEVPVRATIDGEDLCDAVRRCLIKDLVEGLLDEEDKPKRHKKHF
ncbi:hypothetical protein [Salipaludibacillus sp. CF4.18]|uniref:hypothetical protein n=1 Tax=Salipaludibacillus sp. CF4.18 TaxID=3373081 RepID=UPI003EE483E3